MRFTELSPQVGKRLRKSWFTLLPLVLCRYAAILAHQSGQGPPVPRQEVDQLVRRLVQSSGLEDIFWPELRKLERQIAALSSYVALTVSRSGASRFVSRLKNSGTNRMAMNVAANMPPITPVPIEWRLAEPAPVLTASGRT